MRRTTHLTVDRGGVKSNEIENYGYEGAQAHKGVDLPNGKFSPTPRGWMTGGVNSLSLPTHIVHR